jgi:hypothetical protein
MALPPAIGVDRDTDRSAQARDANDDAGAAELRVLRPHFEEDLSVDLDLIRRKIGWSNLTVADSDAGNVIRRG